MKKLRAAVIGCGAIAHHCHIPGYLKNRYTELAALVDPYEKNLKEACAKFNIERGYTSLEDLFANESIDVVSVCSPNIYHAEHAIAALNHGCHVLCEKPMCMNLKEGQMIQKAAQKHPGSIFMVAFTHRLYSGNIKARRMIEQGKIGEPYVIRIRFAHQGPMTGWAMSDWFFTPSKAGGGAMLDMGIHAMDLAQFYFGPIRKINAMMATLEKKIEMEDNAILQFLFASGKMGYAEVGWSSKQGFAGVEIHGSEAAIINDYFEGLYLMKGESSATGKRIIRKRMIDKNPCQGGWDVEIDYFVNAIRKREQPEMGLQAGLNSMKVAMAAYESAKKGKTVTI